MPRVSMGTGALLVLIGVVGYFATGMASWTALIPSMLGGLLIVCGVLALQKESLRKHMMHAAAGISLVGVLGTWRGFGAALVMLRGGEVARPEAAVAQAVTFVILAIFLMLCIRSFVLARRAGAAG